MDGMTTKKESPGFEGDAKLCKDCKFFRGLDNAPYYCYRPVKVETSLVTGAVEYRAKYTTCELEREDSDYLDRCGKDGKYWEECDSAAYRISNFFKNFFR